jgi:hypothetical protein
MKSVCVEEREGTETQPVGDVWLVDAIEEAQSHMADSVVKIVRGNVEADIEEQK